jgi:D-methionine transport system substrate-binding protein
MKLRKFAAVIVAALLLVGSVSALADIKIGVPNDTTNEARALRLLEYNGILELKADAGQTATKADVLTEGIEIVEVEAAMLPNLLPDLDYAVMNLNFVLDAVNAGIEIDDPLLLEDEANYLPNANVIAVKGENADADLTKALVAALQSQQVKDFIAQTYHGAVLSVVDNPTDGYDPDVDYDALAGQTLVVEATPTPHSEILNSVVVGILAEKDITLQVVDVSNYTQENPDVDSGVAYANYFQHQPYLDDQVSQEGYDVVSVGAVHTEPMGLYGSQQKDLSALGK